MKRSQFIRSTLATAASLAAAAKLSANSSREEKGFKTNVGEGRIHGHIKLKGVNANVIDVKVSGKDTDGDLAIFEQTSLSPKRGTPMHLHHSQDEIFYILAGEYLFQVGTDKYSMKAGDTIFLPRKVPHSWIQLSESGKMLVTLQPAGKLEDFFVTMSGLQLDPSPQMMAQLFRDHDMEVVGPPVALP